MNLSEQEDGKTNNLLLYRKKANCHLRFEPKTMICITVSLIKAHSNYCHTIVGCHLPARIKPVNYDTNAVFSCIE